MKAKIFWPLALCLILSACGPQRPSDNDFATRALIDGIDQRNASDIREALKDGARADATASFGNSALHIASLTGDAELATFVLTTLADQKGRSSSLFDIISAANKQGQSALEIAALRRNESVINAFASFCETHGLLRVVFFPVTKKAASDNDPGLELLMNAIASYGASKSHMAHLILETIGTKEGQVIAEYYPPEAFLHDFAKAYVLALLGDAQSQPAFLKVASGFRIEKRIELIALMQAENAKDLYNDLRSQLERLATQFGIPKPAPLPSPGASPSPNESPSVAQGTPTSPITSSIPVDYNALLREAVVQGNTEAMVAALEKGARIDTLDAHLHNVFHLAALHDRGALMSLLLTQLQCSNAEALLLQQSSEGFTPLALAARKERGQTLRALSEFLMAGPVCHELAKKELRSFIKDNQEMAFKNSIRAFSETTRGLEVISDVAFRILNGEHYARTFEWIDQSLCEEAKDHLWARLYWTAIQKYDEARKTTVRERVASFEFSKRQQVLGFVLFLGSASGNALLRDAIMAEIEPLGLSKASFDGSSDDVSGLKDALDAIVTGQDNAKISLSVAIKNHYERVKKGLKKSNILILGPSGSGKTLLVQTIAQKLDVPFAVFDATNITQAGYTGGKATDAVQMLAEKGEFKKEKIERGIIFLDEIDKMASRSGRADQDEFKRQGQASLLKLIEGLEVEVPVNRYENISIDTTNILFVCAGAFTGLPEIIAKRLQGEGLSLGDNPFAQVIAEDIVKYGMAPELLGRLPNVIALKHLSVEDMANILKNPRSSVLEEYKELFLARGVTLNFTEGAILAIAERAVGYKVGARGLRTVAEAVMSDLQYRVGHLGKVKSMTVTERVVRFGDLPLLEYHPEDV